LTLEGRQICPPTQTHASARRSKRPQMESSMLDNKTNRKKSKKRPLLALTKPPVQSQVV
jgi:hypothetical protein